MLHPCVTICSPFRDSSAIVPTYVEQIAALDYPSANIRIVAVEGDSQDNTWAMLNDWYALSNRLTLVKCDTGKPRYGSVVDPERFAVLARVFNTALDAVDLEWSDYVLFIPSDIRYGPSLLRRLLAAGKDIIAPFSWDAPEPERTLRFYDVWAFTRPDGTSFDKFTTFMGQRMFGSAPVRMATVGGTVLMRASVLRAGCRYTPDEVDRGLCRMAAEQGFEVWAAPGIHVYHPPFTDGFEELRDKSPAIVQEAIMNKYGFAVSEQYAVDYVQFMQELLHV